VKSTPCFLRGIRAKIRKALEAGLPAGALTAPGPFLCYLTIDGLDRESDPQKATRLRGRINAAGGQRQTSDHATDSTISIGIRVPPPATGLSAPPGPCSAPRPATGYPGLRPRPRQTGSSPAGLEQPGLDPAEGTLASPIPVAALVLPWLDPG
jgi:hypothetical protein